MFVVDASIALAWCFEDEQTPATTALLDKTIETGAHAPSIFPVEILNALFMAERRQRIDGRKRETLAYFMRGLPIDMDIELHDHLWADTARLAAHFRLTVYDAMYLELAQRKYLPLATFDKALISAAVALGIQTTGS